MYDIDANALVTNVEPGEDEAAAIAKTEAELDAALEQERDADPEQ